MKTSKKIAYAAVGAAVSAVCVFLTNIVPLRVTLLMLAALCYYIVLDKCGIVYGLLGIAAGLIICFAMFGGLSSAFLLTAFIFAPYAILGYFIRKLYYTKWQTALLRVGITAAFANVALVAVWFTAKWITNIDIIAIASRVGGYAVLAIIFTALALVFDVLFNQLSIRLLKLIK